MVPRSSEQFAKMRLDSRQKILESALELFALKGYASTSIASIAEKAGVSKGLIYNYFKSKEDILFQLFDYLYEHIENEYSVEDGEAPEKILEKITRHTIQLIREGNKYFLFLTGIVTQASLRDMLRKHSDQFFSDKLEKFLPLFAALGFENPRKAAYSYAALMDGINLGYITMGKNYPLEEMQEFVLNLYCKK